MAAQESARSSFLEKRLGKPLSTYRSQTSSRQPSALERRLGKSLDEYNQIKEGVRTAAGLVRAVGSGVSQQLEQDILPKVGVGFGQGVRDVAALADKPALALEEKFGPLTMGGLFPTAKQAVEESRAKTEQFKQAGYEEDLPAMLGRAGGQIAATAPIMIPMNIAGQAIGQGIKTVAPAVGPAIDFLAGRTTAPILKTLSRGTQAGMQGAIGNVLANASSGEKSIPELAGEGFSIGSVLGMAPSAVGEIYEAGRSAVLPKLSPRDAALVRRARDLGIDVTVPMTQRNKFLGDLDEMSAKLPFSVSDEVAADRQRQFMSQLVKTTGESADNVRPETLEEVYSNLGKKFEDAVSVLDVPVSQAEQAKARLASFLEESTLTDAEVSPVKRVIDNVINKMTEKASKEGVEEGIEEGVMKVAKKGAKKAAEAAEAAVKGLSGQEIQELIARNSILDKLARSPNPTLKQAGNEIKDILFDAIEDSVSKTQLNEFQKLRGQYKNYKVLERAAGYSNTGSEGVLTPQSLATAVRAVYGPEKVARGETGDMGELARIGQRFFSPGKDAGTAGKLTAISSAADAIRGGLGALTGAAGLAAAGVPAVASLPVVLGANYLGSKVINSPRYMDAVLTQKLFPGPIMQTVSNTARQVSSNPLVQYMTSGGPLTMGTVQIENMSDKRRE